MNRDYIYPEHHVSFSAVILIAILIYSGIPTGACSSVIGTWNIVGELVTLPSEDPYAPKPGTILADTWSIAESRNSLVLTSSKGSMPGEYADSGAVFDGSYPLGSAMYMVVHIECFMSDSSSMYGTINNDYWYVNQVTNVPIKTGLEAWKFRATRQQSSYTSMGLFQ